MSIQRRLTLWYRGLQMGNQIASGATLIKQLPQPCISIFGSSRALLSDTFLANAYDLGQALAINGYGIITGGGPSIMYQTSCGVRDAFPSRINTVLGITVKGVDDDFTNACTPLYQVDTFLARKELLMNYSGAYIFMPGGIGTMDELFTLLNYNKQGIISDKPIILFGSTYWQPLLECYDKAIVDKYIDATYHDFFKVLDSVDQVIHQLNARFIK